MKMILTTAFVALILLLGLQTHTTAQANQISVTCEAGYAESSACVSLGPLGSLNPSGIQLWTRMFISHAVELPKAVMASLRDVFIKLEPSRWRY